MCLVFKTTNCGELLLISWRGYWLVGQLFWVGSATLLSLLLSILNVAPRPQEHLWEPWHITSKMLFSLLISLLPVVAQPGTTHEHSGVSCECEELHCYELSKTTGCGSAGISNEGWVWCQDVSAFASSRLVNSAARNSKKTAGHSSLSTAASITGNLWWWGAFQAWIA